jgi:hypothetical protein
MHNGLKGAAVFLVAAVTAGTILMTNHQTALAKKFKYPEPKKGDVVEDYHGTKVADPYRWMEDPDAKETQAWVDQENVITRGYIDSYPAREAIEDRLKTLFNYERFSVPTREGDRYYYSKNDGLQNQAPIYMQKVGGGDPAMVLDPNTLSADGTVAITGTSYTEDGMLLGYGSPPRAATGRSSTSATSTPARTTTKFSSGASSRVSRGSSTRAASGTTASGGRRAGKRAAGHAQPRVLAQARDAAIRRCHRPQGRSERGARLPAVHLP